MTTCSQNKVVPVRPKTDTFARFTAFNPVLCKNELSYDSTTRKFKVGDGITPWNDLPYNYTGSGGGSGGSEITDSSAITIITTGSNYNDAYGNPSPVLGGVWNNSVAVPAVINENDYYLEPVGTPDGLPRHIIFCKNLASNLTLIKIPYIQ